jgi:hypothetical protein
MKTNRKSLSIFLLLLLVLTTACSWPQKIVGLFVEEYSPSEAWQGEVDRLIDITRDRELPPELLDPTLESGNTLFDANHLLLYMDHLSLREGFTLDFVYVLDANSGYPILYAHGENEASFEDYAAYRAVCDVANPPETCDYLNFVEGDGTETGYFQFVLLGMMSDQFYLYGEAQKNEVEVVADTIRIEGLADSVLSTRDNTLAGWKLARQIRKVDPAPIVTIEDEQVTVEVTWFTPASGLYRTVTVLTEDAPYQVLSKGTEQLVAFDLNVTP